VHAKEALLSAWVSVRSGSGEMRFLKTAHADKALSSANYLFSARQQVLPVSYKNWCACPIHKFREFFIMNNTVEKTAARRQPTSR
jgi:hypothetical protein